MSVYSLNWTVGSPAHSTRCPSNRLVQTSLALRRSQMSAMPKIMFNCGFGVSDGDGDGDGDGAGDGDNSTCSSRAAQFPFLLQLAAMLRQ